MIGYFYIFGTIFFTVYGQVVLKWRIVKYGAMPEGFVDKLIFLFKLLLDPFIFSGFLSAFVASFFWMAAMAKFDLSHAYPIVVGGLVIFTSLLAIIFLKEPTTLFKVVGILLIIVGVYLINKA